MSDLVRRDDLWAAFQQMEDVTRKGVRDMIRDAEAVEVVLCKDCKYRPVLHDVSEYGLKFPDEYKCPCQCDDGYYSWMPEDDWYCANGERREHDAAD